MLDLMNVYLNNSLIQSFIVIYNHLIIHIKMYNIQFKGGPPSDLVTKILLKILKNHPYTP